MALMIIQGLQGSNRLFTGLFALVIKLEALEQLGLQVMLSHRRDLRQLHLIRLDPFK